jgi:hypothetical protein
MVTGDAHLFQECGEDRKKGGFWGEKGEKKTIFYAWRDCLENFLLIPKERLPGVSTVFLDRGRLGKKMSQPTALDIATMHHLELVCENPDAALLILKRATDWCGTASVSEEKIFWFPGRRLTRLTVTKKLGKGLVSVFYRNLPPDPSRKYFSGSHFNEKKKKFFDESYCMCFLQRRSANGSGVSAKLCLDDWNSKTPGKAWTKRVLLVRCWPI